MTTMIDGNPVQTGYGVTNLTFPKIPKGFDRVRNSRMYARVYEVLAPNGQLVKVHPTCNIESNYEEGMTELDSRNEVWVKGAEKIDDQLPYRALPNVNYGDYGFIKINGKWVDPNDSAAVKKANEVANCCLV